MVKIKICGLTREDDILMVNQALPDYIGFVFAKSRRQIEEDRAKNLHSLLDPRIKTVGVFVNETIERIERICKAGSIDIVQLHGEEDKAYIDLLKSSINKPIIKAVRVRNLEDIEAAKHLGGDYLLLDTYKDNQYGGSGEAFDWTMIAKVEMPFYLAGGITNENVERAIQIANPYCIDVSSGVETDGFKDATKIMDIVTKVRSVR